MRYCTGILRKMTNVCMKQGLAKIGMQLVFLVLLDGLRARVLRPSILELTPSLPIVRLEGLCILEIAPIQVCLIWFKMVLSLPNSHFFACPTKWVDGSLA